MADVMADVMAPVARAMMPAIQSDEWFWDTEMLVLAWAAGLDVVMDRCIKIEHARLLGGLNFVGVNTRVISSKRPKVIVN